MRHEQVSSSEILFEYTFYPHFILRFTRRTHPGLMEDDPNGDYLENTCLNGLCLPHMNAKCIEFSSFLINYRMFVSSRKTLRWSAYICS